MKKLVLIIALIFGMNVAMGQRRNIVMTDTFAIENIKAKALAWIKRDTAQFKKCLDCCKKSKELARWGAMQVYINSFGYLIETPGKNTMVADVFIYIEKRKKTNVALLGIMSFEGHKIINEKPIEVVIN